MLTGENLGTCGAFNLGRGSSITIDELAELCFEAFGKNTGKKFRLQRLCEVGHSQAVNYGNDTIMSIFQPQRSGEVRHSQADISANGAALGFSPRVSMREGVQEYVDWAKTAFQTA